MMDKLIDTPKLSVVMPVFNHVDLAQVMIDSIRSNEFADWELWAVDDGSTEENVEKMEQYCSLDSRIHYIHRDREPKGAQTCRNIGFERSRGQYIIFFDSDDKIFPYTLGNRVKALDEHPHLDFMVFPSGVLVKDEYSVINQKYAFGFPVFDDDLRAFAGRTLPFIVWNNIYRTDSLRKADIQWDTNLRSLQDADFNVQVIFSGLKYGYAQVQPDLAYRIDGNTGSVSKKLHSEEHQNSILYALEKFYKEYQSKYGHQYDEALYHGVMTMYNAVMSDGIIDSFADQLSDLVDRYSSYGKKMKCQVKCTKFLCTFLPEKRARQIPMFFFLKERDRLVKEKITAINRILDKDKN